MTASGKLCRYWSRRRIWMLFLSQWIAFIGLTYIQVIVIVDGRVFRPFSPFRPNHNKPWGCNDFTFIYSTSTFSSSRLLSRSVSLVAIRGGGVSGEGDDDDTSNEKKEEDDDVHLTKLRRPRNSLSSPFYMNEMARYEASKMIDTPSRNSTKSKESLSDIIIDQNQENQRDKPKKKKKKKKHHHHEDGDSARSSSIRTKPNDKNKARRKEDDDEKQKGRVVTGGGATTTSENTSIEQTGIPQDEHKSKQHHEKIPTSQKNEQNSNVSNLWWVNMWTHQMYDDDLWSSSKDSDKDQMVETGIDVLPTDTQIRPQESFQQQKDVEIEISAPDDRVSDAKVFTQIVEAGDGDTETLNITTTTVEPSYVSTGVWGSIDNLVTLGLASKYSSLRVSKPLRGVRKWTAHVTGLHGALSGKPSASLIERTLNESFAEAASLEEMNRIQKRIAAINKARERVEQAKAADDEQTKGRRGLFRGLFRRKGGNDEESEVAATSANDTELEGFEQPPPKARQKTPEEIEEELRRMTRVREIDRLIEEGQKRLQDLLCEKDVLQRRPNPLFDYTTIESTTYEVTTEGGDDKTEIAANETDAAIDNTTKSSITSKTIEIKATRKMNFPPDELVAEYLDMMISTRRLIKMNHTYLWKESEFSEDDEEETIGDDLFTASADARRLYQTSTTRASNRNEWENDDGKASGQNGSNGHRGVGGGGGSWLLRQSIGTGPTLGEKIGEAAEIAAYKAVCGSLMSFLARTLSSLHGINVMKHSDIRLVLEQAPDLPPVGTDGVLPGGSKNYAEETIRTVMRRKARIASHRKQSYYRSTEDSFVQKDAVTEMLLSHVQISAPLLKLFPLAWQRALLGNVITLSTAVISDFVDGLYFQILGHQLSFRFRPITEEDMIQHFQTMSRRRKNDRRNRAVEFEAAVKATAEDVSEELKFLDRWHERLLGSGVLRTQIANMIARIVLTLTDEILSGARMDLWSAQAGGPRMLAGLEYRIEDT